MVVKLSEFLNTSFSTYTENDAFNTSVVYPITLTHTTTATPGTGIGTGLKFITETSAGNNEIGGLIEVVTTDVTSTSEDFAFVFKTMAGGNAATESLRIGSTGDLTTAGDLVVNGGQVTLTATSTRDKYRVWTTSDYAIGMQNSVTFGAINNDYAMTFQMSDTANRGFWWGDTTHTVAQGAMALSTDGKLSVAHSLRLGYGESDTTTPGIDFVLDVNGGINATNVDFGNVDIGVTTGFDSWKYNSNSFSFSAQTTDPGGIFVDSTGNRAFIVATDSALVYRYSFTTANKIDTLTDASDDLGIFAQDNQPTSVFLKPNGLELYVTGLDNSSIYQYTLSTAWSLASATYTRTLSVSAVDTIPVGLFFKSDGTKMYLVGQQNADVYQYNLSTAWNISTATYLQTLSLATSAKNPTAITFSDDGSILYITDSKYDSIVKFTLSTAWDISSAVYTDKLDIGDAGGTSLTNPVGIALSETANRLFIICANNDKAFELDLVSPSVRVTGNRFIVNNDVHIKNDLVVYQDARIQKNVEITGTTILHDSLSVTGTITTSATDTATTATHYYVEIASDGVIRPKTLADVKTEIVTTNAVNAAVATTVGVITSGEWQGSVIEGEYGGTGVANTGKTITLGGNFTHTGAHTLGVTTTGNTSITLPTTGTLATTSNKLSVFAATSSSELAGVISDETGSGVLVFGTAPTFTTSIDGGATFGAFASSTALTLGYTSTAASTTNISTGAVASATTKTINLGTGGAAGSTTNINIGSSVAGTTTISSPNITISSLVDTATTATHYYVETASGNILPKTLANVKTEIVTTAAVNSAAATTVGVITSGEWQGTVIGPTYGGTGINNGTKTITLGGNFTHTGAHTLGVTTTANTSITLPTTGTLATTSNKLSDFAATTSAELAGVISDETGSGLLVFATSPTLTTPTLGVASATTINKVTLTTPATGSTLTIADGKTLTASNTLTFTGTDASSVAFGTGGTVAYTGGTLAQFAATTSLQLLGVISDETGTGALVFGTAPTFTTTIDGGATFGAFASSTALTLGYTGTAASTTNISTGAVASSTTKTINLGTGGAAGSTTNINIGDADGGTTAIASPTVTVAGVADTATAATHYYVEIATDGTIRPKTLANVKTEIVTTAAVNSAAATTVGTITSGTWNGSVISATYGGTGLSSLGTGVATFLGTPSSANLATAITDETGSGALVFGTAPTFTTTIDGGATFGAFASSTALTLGYTGTAASTTNISTGAVATSTIKTINLGTGGAAGSTTNINIGDADGGTTTVNNNLTVTGTLTVNGTTTTVNSTTVTVNDPIFTIGGDTAPASDDNKDRGIEFRWHNGTAAKVGFFGFDDSTGYFTFIPDATNTSEVFSGTQGDIQATNFRGALIGNASTATTAAAWTTARTITLAGDLTGNVSIDGSAGVTLTATIAADSVALGTDTTGNYVATVAAGTPGVETSSSGLTIVSVAGEGTATTVAHADTSTLTGAQGTAGIAAFTLDGFGHVTAVTTATYLTAEADTLATVTGRGASTSTQVVLNGGVTTTTTTALTLDSGTTGAINIGTSANAKTITIGNGTGATSLVLNAGTGAINIGTNAFARTITIGNATGASALNLNSGTGIITVDSVTGAINIGTSSNAKTITVGNTTGATAVVVNSGTGGISLNNIKWPTVDGSVGQAIVTNGAGQLSFSSVSGAGLAASSYIAVGILSTDQTITAGADALISFVDYADTQVWWDATSKRFTPNIAGYYDINLSAWFASGAVSNNQTNLQIRKNGNTFALSQELINTFIGQSLMLSRMIYLNGTTDYIDFTVYTANTTSQVLQKGTADGSGTYFTAALISSGGLTGNIVEDTTPQLGGDLDVNGKVIVSATGSNGNILITPDGTGYIQLDGLKWPTADGSNGYLLQTNGAGQLAWTAAGSNTTYTQSAVTTTGGALLRLTGSDASTDDVKFADGNSITVAYTDANTITINHADTSTITGAQGTAGIAAITIDGFGHVTAVTTATYLTAEADTLTTVTGRGASTSTQVVLNGGITTTTTTALTLDSGTTGAINIGTSANAKTITIGNGTGATSLVLNAGTGAINIGTNAFARTITIGNATGASALTLDSGTGAINIGTSIAKTITIGNATGATALALNSGTGNIVLTATTGSVQLVATGANIITATTNGTERMRVGSDGQVSFYGLGDLYGSAIKILASTNVTSERASMIFGDWEIGQDASGNGTKDFYIYGGTVPSSKIIISTTGAITIDGGITTTTTTALTLDSGTTGAINIGTSANAKTITIGNGTGATSLVLNAGTGAINIGTNAFARTITIGNATGASALTLDSGTGAINIGTSIAKTITIGNATGATALALNSGTGAIDIGTSIAKTITIGNVTGATGIVLNSGTAGVTLNTVASGQVKVQASAAPTTDIVQITNTGFGTITAGTSALQVTYVGGAAAIEASAVRIDMTPGGTTGGTWNAIRMVGTSLATGVVGNLIKADTFTPGLGTENVLYVGTGYDNIINYNGTSVINGTGNVIAGQLSGTIPSAVLGNSTVYVGSTAILLNRATGSQTLTGVSIDGSSASTTGNAATVTNGFYTTSSFNLGTTSIAVNRASATQSLTGINIDGSAGSCTGNAGTVTNGVYTTGNQSIAGIKTFTNGTASTTNTTGSVVITGGLGVSGAINAGADVTAYATSDIRLKTNIENIPDALAKVNLLNGVTYNWNDLAHEIEHKDTSVRETGVLAQQVNDVLPEVINIRDNGYMAVRYEKMVPLLIEAIKELTEQNRQLAQRLSDLEDKN
jgi:hypothetical protein